MGVRFRKSVKLVPGVRLNFSSKGVSTTIGGKGFKTTIGKNGVYQSVSIPGSGLSYRTKIAGGGSGRRRSDTAKSSTACSVGSIPAFFLDLDRNSEIVVKESNGRQITDSELLSIIKRSARYKAQLPAMRQRQQALVERKVRDFEKENDSFLSLYRQSPKVRDRTFYELCLKRLEPKCYFPVGYGVPAPTPADIQQQLSREADQNVKGMPWNSRKLKEQYFNERYQIRLNEALRAWQAEKDAFDKAEIEKATALNTAYLEEYDREKQIYQMALDGDSDYIEDAVFQWISSVELPVDISAQFEHRSRQRCVMVDLDLPEIEDLPSEVAVQMANGRMKVKKKTQKDLRAEYAQCVFGLLVFVSANIFGVSPEVQGVVVSGYTQRRDKIGDLIDDYIVSVRFERDGFYDVDFRRIDPEEFCMGFENRCKLTATKMFKVIEPYE